MKKVLIGFSVLLGSLGLALIICRFTGILLIYKQPTDGNTPTIKKGQLFSISNLIKPKVGNFIIYKNDVIDSLENTYAEIKTYGNNYIHRLIAKEGDTVEVNNGVCFVNKKNIDKNLGLYSLYKFPYKNIDLVPEEIFNRTYELGINNDTIKFINLTDKELEQYFSNLNLVKYFYNDSLHCFNWLTQKHNGWTESNFGPLIIPKNKCFVLGDNRLNSMDSRFFGFVDWEKVKGVKL